MYDAEWVNRGLSKGCLHQQLLLAEATWQLPNVDHFYRGLLEKRQKVDDLQF